jgi:hypothetical protein
MAEVALDTADDALAAIVNLDVCPVASTADMNSLLSAIPSGKHKWVKIVLSANVLGLGGLGSNIYVPAEEYIAHLYNGGTSTTYSVWLYGLTTSNKIYLSAGYNGITYYQELLTGLGKTASFSSDYNWVFQRKPNTSPCIIVVPADVLSTSYISHPVGEGIHQVSIGIKFNWTNNTDGAQVLFGIDGILYADSNRGTPVYYGTVVSKLGDRVPVKIAQYVNASPAFNCVGVMLDGTPANNNHIGQECLFTATFFITK